MSQATSSFILTGDATDAVKAFRRAGQEYQRLLKQVRGTAAGVPLTKEGRPDMRTKAARGVDMTSPATPAEKRQVEQLMKQQGFDQDVISETGMTGLTAKNQVASMKEVGGSYSDLQNKAKNLGQETVILTKRHQDLGVQSGLNTSQVYKLRMAIETLLKTEGVSTALGKARVTQLREQEAGLKAVEAQVTQLNNRMVFMKGAAIGVQDSIRNSGAAAQGAMLGMSALNGDVMGLAFSLIFLQFSANIPLTFSFAALSVAAALAFKGIKKILKERKEMKLLGNSFFIVTRSMESMDLARQRAVGVVDKLGLATKDEEEVVKALLQAQMALRAQGIEPTSDALKVAAASFLVTKSRTDDFEKSVEAALESVTSFADTGIPSIGSVEMSMGELAKQGAAAIKILQDFGNAGDITFGQLKDIATEAGVDWNPFLDTFDPEAWVGQMDKAIDLALATGGTEVLQTPWVRKNSKAVRIANLIKDEVAAVNPELVFSIARMETSFNEAFAIVKPLGEDNSTVGLAFINFQKNMKAAFDSDDPVKELSILATQASMTAKSGGMTNLQRTFDSLKEKANAVAKATTAIRDALTDTTLTNYLDSLTGFQDVISLGEGFSGEQEGGPFRHGYGGITVNVYDNVVKSDDQLATKVVKAVSSNINVSTYGGRM
tara:strand:+ start:14431 stop:16413 length:1983 start_codon:yes stop_codon:yes gene_type:complete